MGAPSAAISSMVIVTPLLADAECSYRDTRKLQLRLKQAKLRQPACIEDIDYRHPRGLSKLLLLDLASSQWVARHQPWPLARETCGCGQRARFVATYLTPAMPSKSAS